MYRLYHQAQIPMALQPSTRLGPSEITARIGVPCPWSKRLTDVVCSGLALVLVAPLLLIVAALIKLSGLVHPEDKGPVLRFKTRYSAGQPFRCYKFRVIKQGVLQREHPIRSVVRAKDIEQDENCTAVGRWLKKWYLDELPQLCHIWRGEMSLAGPRPFRVEDYEEELRQHAVDVRTARAGLTGLLQIHKGIPSEQTKHELEMEYIEKSQTMRPGLLWFYDVGIILRTFRVLWQGKGI